MCQTGNAAGNASPLRPLGPVSEEKIMRIRELFRIVTRQSAQRPGSRSRAARIRPRLEALETRMALSDLGTGVVPIDAPAQLDGQSASATLAS